MRNLLAPYYGDLFHGTSLRAARKIRDEGVIRANTAGYVSFAADPGTAKLYAMYRGGGEGSGVVIRFPASDVDAGKVTRDPEHERGQLAYLYRGNLQLSRVEWSDADPTWYHSSR